jgi:hypothetical protein
MIVLNKRRKKITRNNKRKMIMAKNKVIRKMANK